MSNGAILGAVGAISSAAAGGGTAAAVQAQGLGRTEKLRRAAFIGTGNMGGALIRAACRAVGAEEVIIADYQADKAAALAGELGCAAAADNNEAAAGAKYVFLCVKPQVLPQVAAALADTLSACLERGEEKVIVSIAAGVQIASIRGYLDGVKGTLPILRVMPNTCAAIGQGMLALTDGGAGLDQELAGAEAILAQAGRVERMAEGLMDAFTAVAGCGPAYVYPFIEALADGGVMAGLPRAQAQLFAAQTVLGAAAMVLESGEHPGALKDAVCSPGGSTIAGVAELENRGFRAAAIQAVLAAYEKNIQLGKQK
jgi:pyrroline-5-carboxylate reductase